MGDSIWKEAQIKPSTTSFLRISPRVELDGKTHLPVVDIFWNTETEQVDVSFEGSVSDAAKSFMLVLGETMMDHFIAIQKETDNG